MRRIVASVYELVERLPGPAESRRICTAVGWEPVMKFDAAPAALARSLYAVVALRGGEAVGMGRIAGDGVIYFYLQACSRRCRVASGLTLVPRRTADWRFPLDAA